MSLPKLETPLFNLPLPLSKKKVNYRPFLVGEEKIILIALESKDDAEIIVAIKRLLDNCVEDCDITNLPFIDLEYLFINLRAKSVGETVEVSIKDNEDGQVRNFNIDLEQVEVNIPDDYTTTIPLTDTVGIVMKHPSLSTVENMSLNVEEMTVEDNFRLVTACIESVYDGESVYPFSDNTQEEIDEFLGQLNNEQWANIQNFFVNMPTVTYSIEYTNDKGTEVKHTLRGILDFFT